jgi:hypothetical protein
MTLQDTRVNLTARFTLKSGGFMRLFDDGVNLGESLPPMTQPFCTGVARTSWGIRRVQP